MPGNRPKLLYQAIALKNGFNAADNLAAQTPKEYQVFYQLGQELQYYLDTAWRRAGGHSPSRAAHYKRLAKKRNNIRVRGKK